MLFRSKWFSTYLLRFFYLYFQSHARQYFELAAILGKEVPRPDSKFVNVDKEKKTYQCGQIILRDKGSGYGPVVYYEVEGKTPEKTLQRQFVVDQASLYPSGVIRDILEVLPSVSTNKKRIMAIEQLCWLGVRSPPA